MCTRDDFQRYGVENRSSVISLCDMRKNSQPDKGSSNSVESFLLLTENLQHIVLTTTGRKSSTMARHTGTIFEIPNCENTEL